MINSQTITNANDRTSADEAMTGEWVRGMAATSYRGWKAFYHTKEWQRKREEILRRDHYSCQRCKEAGRYSRADTVHHVMHLRDAPELALTDGNLMSLCNACHEEIHAEDRRAERGGYSNSERW